MILIRLVEFKEKIRYYVADNNVLDVLKDVLDENYSKFKVSNFEQIVEDIEYDEKFDFSILIWKVSNKRMINISDIKDEEDKCDLTISIVGDIIKYEMEYENSLEEELLGVIKQKYDTKNYRYSDGV